MKALIVDNDSGTLKALESFFAIRGFTVTTASSGVDAWNGLIDPRKWKKLPDVIITEMVLDGMQGVDFIRRLRMMSGMSNVPIIAISADEREIDKALLVGATSCFMKPLQPELIMKVSERLIAETQAFAAENTLAAPISASTSGY
ncbi:MAG TPA: response regulator [Blastocatellia bacterium]|nr:response regulator [Blastocatellia bacterium]